MWHIAYPVKSRRSSSRLQPKVPAMPRSCPLAFHTFAYHLLGCWAGSKSVGVPVPVPVPGLLIAGDTCRAAFSCLPLATCHLQLATGAVAFPLPGHALVRSEALNDIVSFFAFPCALLSVFPALFCIFFIFVFVFLYSFIFAVAALKCATALSRATWWHLQTVAATAMATAKGGSQVILAKAELSSVAAARQINHTA